MGLHRPRLSRYHTPYKKWRVCKNVILCGGQYYRTPNRKLSSKKSKLMIIKQTVRHVISSLLRIGWRFFTDSRQRTLSGTMESHPSALLLEDFLDAFPKPAMILGSQDQQLSGDSFQVYYANRAFLAIIGDVAGLAGEGSLTSMLKAKCVHPAIPRFFSWIDTVLRSPRAGHGLRTSFQGNESIGDRPATAHQKIVDIKWKALVLKSTYVILTGKTTGTSSYFTGGANPVRPSLLRMPSQTSIDSADSQQAIAAISPGSTTLSDGGQGTEVSPSYFTGAFREGKVTFPKGLHPWRHREKVKYQGKHR